MPTILPISDLKNYPEVLEKTEEGEVYLARNGRSGYVVLKQEDYERLEHMVKMFAALREGEESGAREGWVDWTYSRSIDIWCRVKVWCSTLLPKISSR